jgi:diaminopimelate epimerase
MHDPLTFAKGHGTENDFVILPDPHGALDLTSRQVAAICDRRAGVGADGVLRVVPTKLMPGHSDAAGDAPWFMDYRNADGSVAEMCGNGIRVYGRYLVAHGLVAPGEITVATRAGLRSLRVPEHGEVTVDMGVPTFPAPSPVRVATVSGWADAVNVSMGNPHAVAFVADLAVAGDLRTAPAVTPADAYPDGVNVEYVVRTGEHRVRMRVHERGSGETRSCGTGACAVMIATARADGAPPLTPYLVDVPGGRLRIVERADGHLEMTGPAVIVAEGTLTPGWIDA